MKAVVLFNEVSDHAAPDDQDVLAAVQAVSGSLNELGYDAVPLPTSLDLRHTRAKLAALRPAVVFNLVESLDGSGRLAHFIPALLEELKLPYTGGSAFSIMVTTDKLLTKTHLHQGGVATPAWSRSSAVDFPPPYIIKPTREDASVGIDADAVVTDRQKLPAAFEERVRRFGECFVEAYVDGREFNLSVLGGADGPEVLPAAEIIFRGFDDRPRIVDYTAKWELDSFEYQNTVRTLEFDAADAPLLARLAETALQCWRLFECRGYVRVDFRVTTAGEPLVLEVNVNPCISPDAGFPAAAARAGMTYTQMIERIVQDALRRGVPR